MRLYREQIRKYEIINDREINMMKQIIILAGGKGARMNGDGPKVLRPVLGKPMIDYVLDAVEKCSLARKPIVVVGFEGEKVKKQIGRRAELVRQNEQLGTGHAVSCVKERAQDLDGAILVLYGDHPLISNRTIDHLFDWHFQNRAMITMMTTLVDDFTAWRQGFFSFGRILRDSAGNIRGIREFKDCVEEEKAIKELNPGYYCFDSKWLWQNIDLLRNENSQREYYLTDLIGLAFQQNQSINSIQIHPLECVGVNTSEQLALIENLLKNRI